MNTSDQKPVSDQMALISQQAELKQLIAQYAKTAGVYETPISSLFLARIDQPSAPVHTVHKPAFCIIVQGLKRTMLADEVFYYSAGQYMVVSLDLPVVGQVVEATPEVPYLGLRIDLDPQQIGELLMTLKSQPSPPSKNTTAGCGMFVSNLHASLLDAVLRLVRLLTSPEDISVLAPMAMREIIYRLLQDDQAEILRQIVMSDSQAKHISKAIDLIKRDYNKTLRIEDMARIANMSVSSLHHHFKAVTAMSPLQYQKQLRLQEARRLLFTEMADAATAGHLVGYQSPSQFSREYNRLFGSPPARDVARLRSSGVLAVA
ncbi:AraC family transcriptional regulator [Glaciimonas soli]|uniref:Helix-turn-helix domain-containing protein n=1 Tax=Glaciimonas soli TaxID=2590999 RepID=A0A843YR31_9BURK|nr:AraC family transcriptional regulator [Glaciimonas soli]MQQ99840.1 helix-turn-helix domain-containing protein [Glaciimonas soli]